MTVCTHLQVWRMQKKEKDPRPDNNNTPTMIRRARLVAVTIPVLRVAGPQLTLCQHTATHSATTFFRGSRLFENRVGSVPLPGPPHDYVNTPSGGECEEIINKVPLLGIGTTTTTGLSQCGSSMTTSHVRQPPSPPPLVCSKVRL